MSDRTDAPAGAAFGAPGGYMTGVAMWIVYRR